MTKKISIAILGASGYTGAELIRLLARHPYVNISAIGADRKAGMRLAEVFPHLSFLDLPPLQKIEDIDYEAIDLVFCALPHGLTQEVVKSLPSHLRVIDLSADFRLRKAEDYKKWYGHDHVAMELQESFTYGLCEFYRDELMMATHVANTGCYVASSLLALLPLVGMEVIDTNNIIIDAKSGTSGAGRSLKEDLLFTEVNEGFSAYSVASHRHSGEIDQELSKMAGFDVNPRFTPHLLPQNRCILSTIYVDLKGNNSAQDIHHILEKRYEHEYFVKVLPFGSVPKTHYVKGSNYVMIGVVSDRIEGKAKIICVLDNLIKGASGQAIQNMNIMYGFPEETAINQLPMFP